MAQLNSGNYHEVMSRILGLEQPSLKASPKPEAAEPVCEISLEFCIWVQKYMDQLCEFEEVTSFMVQAQMEAEMVADAER